MDHPTPPPAVGGDVAERAGRLLSLDVARGFTLLGILYANILWLSGFLDLGATYRAALSGSAVDQGALFAVRVLIFGKFYSLFSFFFGVGFALMVSRAAARREAFGRYYLWRMACLFGIGVAHAVFLWWGDILRLYAVLGAVLLLARGLTNRRLLLLAAGCLVLPLVVFATRTWLWPDLTRPRLAPTASAGLLELYRAGTYGDWFAYNLERIADHAVLQLWSGRVFRVLGMFLAGMWVARLELFKHPDRFRRPLRRLVLVGGPVGLALNVTRVLLVSYLDVDVSPRWYGLMVELLYLVGVPLLAFAYLAGVVLWCDRRGEGRATLALARLGRLSLTTYVMQTVLCCAVFRSWGLGLYAEVGVAAQAALATGLLALQVALAQLWLRRYRQGPLEWGWRRLARALSR